MSGYPSSGQGGPPPFYIPYPVSNNFQHRPDWSNRGEGYAPYAPQIPMRGPSPQMQGQAALSHLFYNRVTPHVFQTSNSCTYPSADREQLPFMPELPDQINASRTPVYKYPASVTSQPQQIQQIQTQQIQQIQPQQIQQMQLQHIQQMQSQKIQPQQMRVEASTCAAYCSDALASMQATGEASRSCATPTTPSASHGYPSRGYDFAPSIDGMGKELCTKPWTDHAKVVGGHFNLAAPEFKPRTSSTTCDVGMSKPQSDPKEEKPTTSLKMTDLNHSHSSELRVTARDTDGKDVLHCSKSVQPNLDNRSSPSLPSFLCSSSVGWSTWKEAKKYKMGGLVADSETGDSRSKTEHGQLSTEKLLSEGNDKEYTSSSLSVMKPEGTEHEQSRTENMNYKGSRTKSADTSSNPCVIDCNGTNHEQLTENMSSEDSKNADISFNTCVTDTSGTTCEQPRAENLSSEGTESMDASFSPCVVLSKKIKPEELSADKQDSEDHKSIDTPSNLCVRDIEESKPEHPTAERLKTGAESSVCTSFGHFLVEDEKAGQEQPSIEKQSSECYEGADTSPSLSLVDIKKTEHKVSGEIKSEGCVCVETFPELSNLDVKGTEQNRVENVVSEDFKSTDMLSRFCVIDSKKAEDEQFSTVKQSSEWCKNSNMPFRPFVRKNKMTEEEHPESKKQKSNHCGNAEMTFAMASKVHKSSQTDSPGDREKKKVDHTSPCQRVINLQMELCQLRAQFCLNELHRQCFDLELDTYWWKTNFRSLRPNPLRDANSTIQNRLQNLRFQIRQIELQRDQCLNILKTGRVLHEIPSFTISLANGELVKPASNEGKSFALATDTTVMGPSSCVACPFIFSFTTSTTFPGMDAIATTPSIAPWPVSAPIMSPFVKPKSYPSISPVMVAGLGPSSVSVTSSLKSSSPFSLPSQVVTAHFAGKNTAHVLSTRSIPAAASPSPTPYLFTNTFCTAPLPSSASLVSCSETASVVFSSACRSKYMKEHQRCDGHDVSFSTQAAGSGKESSVILSSERDRPDSQGTELPKTILPPSVCFVPATTQTVSGASSSLVQSNVNSIPSVSVKSSQPASSAVFNVHSFMQAVASSGSGLDSSDKATVITSALSEIRLLLEQTCTSVTVLSDGSIALQAVSLTGSAAPVDRVQDSMAVSSCKGKNTSKDIKSSSAALSAKDIKSSSAAPSAKDIKNSSAASSAKDIKSSPIASVAKNAKSSSAGSSARDIKSSPAALSQKDIKGSSAASSAKDINSSSAASSAKNIKSSPTASSAKDINSSSAASSAKDINSSPTASSAKNIKSSPTASSAKDINSSPTASSAKNIKSSPTASSAKDINSSPTASSAKNIKSSPTASSAKDIKSSPAASSAKDISSSPASSSAKDINSSPAASSAKDIKSSPAASSAKDISSSPAASSAKDINSSPAASSAKDIKSSPAASSVERKDGKKSCLAASSVEDQYGSKAALSAEDSSSSTTLSTVDKGDCSQAVAFVAGKDHSVGVALVAGKDCSVAAELSSQKDHSHVSLSAEGKDTSLACSSSNGKKKPCTILSRDGKDSSSATLLPNGKSSLHSVLSANEKDSSLSEDEKNGLVVVTPIEDKSSETLLSAEEPATSDKSTSHCIVFLPDKNLISETVSVIENGVQTASVKEGNGLISKAVSVTDSNSGRLINFTTENSLGKTLKQKAATDVCHTAGSIGGTAWKEEQFSMMEKSSESYHMINTNMCQANSGQQKVIQSADCQGPRSEEAESGVDKLKGDHHSRDFFNEFDRIEVQKENNAPNSLSCQNKISMTVVSRADKSDVHVVAMPSADQNSAIENISEEKNFDIEAKDGDVIPKDNSSFPPKTLNSKDSAVSSSGSSSSVPCHQKTTAAENMDKEILLCRSRKEPSPFSRSEKLTSGDQAVQTSLEPQSAYKLGIATDCIPPGMNDPEPVTKGKKEVPWKDLGNTDFVKISYTGTSLSTDKPKCKKPVDMFAVETDTEEEEESAFGDCEDLLEKIKPVQECEAKGKVDVQSETEPTYTRDAAVGTAEAPHSFTVSRTAMDSAGKAVSSTVQGIVVSSAGNAVSSTVQETVVSHVKALISSIQGTTVSSAGNAVSSTVQGTVVSRVKALISSIQGTTVSSVGKALSSTAQGTTVSSVGKAQGTAVSSAGKAPLPSTIQGTAVGSTREAPDSSTVPGDAVNSSGKSSLSSTAQLTAVSSAGKAPPSSTAQDIAVSSAEAPVSSTVLGTGASSVKEALLSSTIHGTTVSSAGDAPLSYTVLGTSIGSVRKVPTFSSAQGTAVSNAVKAPFSSKVQGTAVGSEREAPLSSTVQEAAVGSAKVPQSFTDQGMSMGSIEGAPFSPTDRGTAVGIQMTAAHQCNVPMPSSPRKLVFELLADGAGQEGPSQSVLEKAVTYDNGYCGDAASVGTQQRDGSYGDGRAVLIAENEGTKEDVCYWDEHSGGKLDREIVLRSVTDRLKQLYPIRAMDPHWLQKTAEEQTLLCLQQLDSSFSGDASGPAVYETYGSGMKTSPVPTSQALQPSTQQSMNQLQTADEYQESQFQVWQSHYPTGRKEELEMKWKEAIAQEKEAMEEQTRLLKRAAETQHVMKESVQCLLGNPCDALLLEVSRTTSEYKNLLVEVSKAMANVVHFQQLQKQYSELLESEYPTEPSILHRVNIPLLAKPPNEPNLDLVMASLDALYADLCRPRSSPLVKDSDVQHSQLIPQPVCAGDTHISDHLAGFIPTTVMPSPTVPSTAAPFTWLSSAALTTAQPSTFSWLGSLTTRSDANMQTDRVVKASRNAGAGCIPANSLRSVCPDSLKASSATSSFSFVRPGRQTTGSAFKQPTFSNFGSAPVKTAENTTGESSMPLTKGGRPSFAYSSPAVSVGVSPKLGTEPFSEVCRSGSSKNGASSKAVISCSSPVLPTSEKASTSQENQKTRPSSLSPSSDSTLTSSSLECPSSPQGFAAVLPIRPIITSYNPYTALDKRRSGAGCNSSPEMEQKAEDQKAESVLLSVSASFTAKKSSATDGGVQARGKKNAALEFGESLDTHNKKRNVQYDPKNQDTLWRELQSSDDENKWQVCTSKKRGSRQGTKKKNQGRHHQRTTAARKGLQPNSSSSKGQGLSLSATQICSSTHHNSPPGFHVPQNTFAASAENRLAGTNPFESVLDLNSTGSKHLVGNGSHCDTKAQALPSLLSLKSRPPLSSPSTLMSVKPELQKPARPHPQNSSPTNSLLQLKHFSFSKKLDTTAKRWGPSSSSVSGDSFGQASCGSSNRRWEKSMEIPERSSMSKGAEHSNRDKGEDTSVHGGFQMIGKRTETNGNQVDPVDLAAESKDTSRAKDPPAKMTAYKKLCINILKDFPHLTQEDVSRVIDDVKRACGGHFHGKLFSDIMKDVRKMVLQRYPEKLRAEPQPKPVFSDMNSRKKDNKQPDKKQSGTWQNLEPGFGMQCKTAEDECSICLIEFVPGSQYRLDCGHTFHKQCIDRWVKDQCERSCPMCRAMVLMKEDFPQLGKE